MQYKSWYIVLLMENSEKVGRKYTKENILAQS